MTRLLHIESSPRMARSDEQRHGSHTRRLGARFVARWRAARPDDEICFRDVALHPPTPPTERFVHAAFTPPTAREPWMHDVLAESDALVDELIAADVIVAGVPMYNFGVPATFKAYIDNVIRVGRTFGFDRARGPEPYFPMLADHGKQFVVLSARGDYGYADRIAERNHVEPHIRWAMAYVGITDFHSVAIEYDEFPGERLAASIAEAEAATDALVDRLVAVSPVSR